VLSGYARSALEATAPTATPPRVLVIDDEAAPRRVLAEVVARVGGASDTAANVEDARALLERQRYACALIDRNIGSESGLDLLRHVREMHPQTDAIIITGYPNLPSAVEALRLGAVDYFSKPFEIPALIHRLRLVLERRALLDERRHLPTLVHEDRMAMLGRLSAGVAHEINNPLTFVTGNVEIAQQQLDRLLAPGAEDPRPMLEELKRYLDDAAIGTTRIKQLVADLRTFARTPGDEEEPVDIHRAIEGALKMASHELRPRARVARDYRADRPVLGDVGRLMQVFINLIVNAAQAITGPYEGAEVRVTTWMDGDCVVAEVRDTGVGIPEDYLKRLFEPFFTTKPRGVGTGLGLSISRAIVESLRGEIEVETQVGVGSAFRVRLPAA
jgi:two-component system NtrC family sensor kinase